MHPGQQSKIIHFFELILQRIGTIKWAFIRDKRLSKWIKNCDSGQVEVQLNKSFLKYKEEILQRKRSINAIIIAICASQVNWKLFWLYFE